MTTKDLIEEIDRRIDKLENVLQLQPSTVLKNGYIGGLRQLHDLKKWIQENEE